MSKTTSDVLIERLIDWSVDTIFGFPGDGVNDIFKALRTRQDQIKFVQVRHADIYAQPFPLPPASQLKQAGNIINAGSRVTILAGRCAGQGNVGL